MAALRYFILIAACVGINALGADNLLIFKGLLGKTYEIRGDNSTLGKEVQEQVALIEGIQPEEVRIVIKGLGVEPQMTLGDAARITIGKERIENISGRSRHVIIRCKDSDAPAAVQQPAPRSGAFYKGGIFEERFDH